MNMTKRTMVALLIGALVMMGGAHEAQAAKPKGKGWVSLFNGKNFHGWSVPEQNDGRWTIVDGVIDVNPKIIKAAKGQPRPDLTLWSKESYGDVTVQFDWRIKELKGMYATPIVLPDGSYKKDADGKDIKINQPGADSGFYVRGTSKAQINIWRWPVGSGEVYGYRNDKSQPASVRAGVTPKVNADKPVGEWNTMRVTIKGDRLTVVLNGQSVLKNAQLPGVPAEGRLALQHHGGYDPVKKEWNGASSLVQFRDIYVKELK